MNRTVFSTLKSQSLATGSEIVFFSLKNRVLPQFWNPLSVNFTFYSHIFACFFSCLAVARSTQSLLCFVDLCWSCLSFWYECPVEAYLCLFSTCNRYHVCAHSKLALVLVTSSEQVLQQHDSLPHVSTGMSLTRRGMPLHHQSPSKISLWSSPC